MANENGSLDDMVNEIMATFKAQLLENMKRAMVASLPNFAPAPPAPPVAPVAPVAPVTPARRGPIPRGERTPVPTEWHGATFLPFAPVDLTCRGRVNPSLLPSRSDDRYRGADVVRGLKVKVSTGSVYDVQARVQTRDTVPGPETTVPAVDVLTAVLASPGQTVWRRSGSDALVCGSPGGAPVTVTLAGRTLHAVCYFSTV